MNDEVSKPPPPGPAFNAVDAHSSDPGKILSDLREYVAQYRVVSAAIEEGGELFAASTQIRGLLVELALKTYLASHDVLQEGHDLSALADQCESHGFTFTGDDREHVINKLNERYNYDDALVWQYASASATPGGLTIAPGHDSVDALVARLVAPAS